jgi:hypothetical protein
VDEDRCDLIGADSADKEDGHGQATLTELLQAVRAPEVLALVSVLLAVISLAGLGLLNGSPYLPALSSGSVPPDKSAAVAVSLLGAALALIPATLGAIALYRLQSPSSWRAIAGAGLLLALLSLVLRLTVAAMVAADDAVQFVQF